MPIPVHVPGYTRISARDNVLTQLQKWIIEGTLQPAEKLSDVELAKALQVSRTPVREALQMLELQGFVELIPGKETRVSEIHRDDVFKIYPPLAMLEGFNAQEATRRVTPSLLDRLKSINQEFRHALDVHNALEAMEWDRQFHGLIAKTADNPYVMTFTKTLHMHASRLEYLFFRDLLVPAHMSENEHDAIDELSLRLAFTRPRRGVPRSPSEVPGSVTYACEPLASHVLCRSPQA